MRRLSAFSASLLLALLLGPRDARAQSPAAQALFDQGRQALAAGQLETACARFRASDQLDPAVGTRANLADCEERRGKVASAWEAFRSALEKAPSGDRRIPVFQKRIKALETRLPWLVLTLAPGAPKGTTVREEEVMLGAGATFGVPLALDPGVHHLSVLFPGRSPKSLDVTLSEGKTTTIAIEPEPAGSEAAARDAASPSPPAGEPADRRRLVHVHTESPTVTLFAVVPEGERPLCRAPCDKMIAPGLDTFFIGGDGITTSEQFELHPRGETTIRVHAGSSARRGGGIALAAVGSVATIAGSILMAWVLTYPDPNAILYPEAVVAGGGVTIAAGIGLVVGGAVLIRQGRTTVDILGPQAASGPPLLFRF